MQILLLFALLGALTQPLHSLATRSIQTVAAPDWTKLPQLNSERVSLPVVPRGHQEPRSRQKTPLARRRISTRAPP